MRFPRGGAPAALPLSDSEKLLFGGALRYDKSFTRNETPLTRLSFWHMARQFPAMTGMVGRAAWREDPRALLTLLAAELGQGLMRAFVLVATNRALVALFSSEPTAERLRQAAPALLGGMAVTAVAALLSAVSVAAAGRLEPKVERACTARFYRAAVRVELAAMEDETVHRALDAGRFGTDSVRRMLGSSVMVLNALVGMVAAAAVLAVLHPVLVLTLLLIAAPKGWGAVVSVRRQYVSRHVWLEHRRAIDVITHALVQQDTAPEIRAHSAGRLLVGAYDDMAATVGAEQQRLARAKALTQTATSSVSGLAALGAYAVLWLLLARGGMPLAVAGTAVIAVRTAGAGLNSVVMQFNRMYEESMYLRDLEEACRVAERHAIPAGGVPLPDGMTEVRLEKVSFTYPGAPAPALREVSLTIPQGKVVALVGENGSGKTTLSKLVAGLYVPTSGTLRWNGVDVLEADRDAVFDRVAVLGQDFPHWPMTARANIHIGRSDVPLDQGRVRRAAAEADAEGIIESLPHRWDSLVLKGFERGTQLSGGQWQRLGSARARYRRAPLLIVDEPTSALDPKAEIDAFRALRSLTGDGTTVLLITHRLAATASADLIYVLDGGSLVEQGSHEELMALEDGAYRFAYEIQAAQYGLSPSSDGHVPRPARPAGAMPPAPSGADGT
ncbi:ABC transporter [Streptomyces eurocidicus]|uniref:ABC transporter n=1 Tax=Streptomyces eurocidicus TaxID=66423 RepID=A0A2N8NVC1_STREU|nr:ABC transporter ATP-binding protein [Streptomyces eurocidicus]MBB5122974.1 ATP-binding cassette subfamily B protein [Streptomyces eurocidicus]MBF6056543.1 ATP-binding cassette domain-containing protein [Streptomyces eurocidicus]PNE32736.1 ABC transporter [Streptomyces eurocidicus]